MTSLESVLEYVKSRYVTARKARNKREIILWGCLIGDWETTSKINKKELSIEDFYGIVRSHINGIKINIAEVTKIGPSEEYTEGLLSDLTDLEAILPRQMTAEEIKAAFLAFERDGVASNMGQAMKALKENYPSQYDGKLASAIAKEVF